MKKQDTKDYLLETAMNKIDLAEAAAKEVPYAHYEAIRELLIDARMAIRKARSNEYEIKTLMRHIRISASKLDERVNQNDYPQAYNYLKNLTETLCEMLPLIEAEIEENSRLDRYG